MRNNLDKSGMSKTQDSFKNSAGSGRNFDPNIPFLTTTGGKPSNVYHKNSEINNVMEQNRPSYVMNTRSPSQVDDGT